MLIGKGKDGELATLRAIPQHQGALEQLRVPGNTPGAMATTVLHSWPGKTLKRKNDHLEQRGISTIPPGAQYGAAVRLTPAQ